MPTSLRIQNIQRNPSISRQDFHQLAAKMMDRKGVTGSVKEGLKKSGVFYGKKNLTKREFEKGIRKFTEHLDQNGVKENRYSREIKASLRGKSGFIRGSEAEKAFKTGVRAQTGGRVVIKRLSDLKMGDRRALIATYINTGGLSKQKREEMVAMGLDPEKGLEELKQVSKRIMARNQDERARDIEEETKKAKAQEASGGKTDESGSVESYHRAQEAKDDKGAGNSQGQPASPKTVPLQGGIGGSLSRIDRPEIGGVQEVGLEREITAIEQGLVQNSRSFEKSAEMPKAEHPGLHAETEVAEKKAEIDDMEI